MVHFVGNRGLSNNQHDARMTSKLPKTFSSFIGPDDCRVFWPTMD